MATRTLIGSVEFEIGAGLFGSTHNRRRIGLPVFQMKKRADRRMEKGERDVLRQPVVTTEYARH